MDCRITKENIDLYIDGMLSSAQSDELEAHVEVCVGCHNALEDALRLKKALSALSEIEPPKGLVKEAVRKARKRRGVPFAYISVATAAVVALVIILTSSMLPNMANVAGKGTENVMMAASEGAAEANADKPAEDNINAEEAPKDNADNRNYLMNEQPACVTEAPAAPELAQTELSRFEASDIITDGDTETESTDTRENIVGTEATAPSCIVYVSDERRVDIRSALESIIATYNIEFTSINDGITETLSFILTEEALEEVYELTIDIPMEGELIVDQMIEFQFNL